MANFFYCWDWAGPQEACISTFLPLGYFDWEVGYPYSISQLLAIYEKEETCSRIICYSSVFFPAFSYYYISDRNKLNVFFHFYFFLFCSGFYQ